jgi:hypothetical protein
VKWVTGGQTMRMSVTMVSAAVYMTPSKLRLNGEGNLNNLQRRQCRWRSADCFFSSSYDINVVHCSRPRITLRRSNQAYRRKWPFATSGSGQCTGSCIDIRTNLINYSTTSVVFPRSFLTIVWSSFRTRVFVPPQGPIPCLVMLDQR